MPATARTTISNVHHQAVGFAPPVAVTLSGDAIRLMLQLQDIAPLDNLADAFPHVVNKLAELWKRPYHADRYFDDLLHDTRGSRAGFPLSALSEISNVYDHYRTNIFPVQQDSWSKALYI
jgi:hypothetical protein